MVIRVTLMVIRVKKKQTEPNEKENIHRTIRGGSHARPHGTHGRQRDRHKQPGRGTRGQRQQRTCTRKRNLTMGLRVELINS